MDKAIERGAAQLDAMASCMPADGSSSRSDWPAPEPVAESLLPVEPFDIELMPRSLQPWVKDIAERLQCPPDYIAVTVLGALGTVIGRRVGVRPKSRDDWTEYANLWVAIIGRPGMMKSPSQKEGLAPLNRLGALVQKAYEADMRDYAGELELHEMRLEASKNAVKVKLKSDPAAMIRRDRFDEPKKPVLKRYVVNDATVEALLDIVIENPQGVCVYRDEIVSLLKSLEREGQEGARGFYLSGWAGNANYTADRIGRGRNMRAEAVCLSVMGSTQPGRISVYLRDAIQGNAGDDGLIQRFGLLVWPDVEREWKNVDRAPDAEAKRQAFAVFERLDAADPVADWQAESVIGFDGQPVEGKPPFLRLDEGAAEVFLEWRIQLEEKIRSGHLHPAVESHLAKYRKLVPAIALICHLADGGTGPISEEAMTRALAWAHYLESHALRAYGSVTVADVAGAKELMKRIRKGELQDGFSARDVYRNQWSLLSTKGEAEKAIDILVDHGWLRRHIQKTEGRDKVAYQIHPDLAAGKVAA